MSDASRIVYLDTEFDPRNPTLTGLLSIGLTDSRFPAANYYAVNLDADLEALADHRFIVSQVLPHLPVKVVQFSAQWVDSITWDTEHHDYLQYGRTAAQIADEITAYFPGEEEPQLLANWGKDDISYLHRLFGNDWAAMPPGVPRIFTDLEIMRRQLGAPEPPLTLAQIGDEHHALADARYNRAFHRYLLDFQEQQRIGSDDLAQLLYSAHTANAGARPAQPARPAGTPRPDWAELPDAQRQHHQHVAQALLDRCEVRRPRDGGR